MARRKKDDPIYDKASKLIEDMSTQLRLIIKQEGFKGDHLRVIVGVPDTFIDQVLQRKYSPAKSYNVLSLLRLLDFFGYDIMLVKRRETYKWAEDAEIQARIHKHNKYFRDFKAKRSKTHQQNEREDTREINDGQIKVKTVRKLRGSDMYQPKPMAVNIYSKEEIERARSKEDFFSNE